MQDTTRHSNLHSGFSVQTPQSVAHTRELVSASYLLKTVSAYAFTPQQFANEISCLPLTDSQQIMCAMAESRENFLVLSSPETGSSAAAALIAWRHVLSQRNNRVLIISPSPSTFRAAKQILHCSEHDISTLAFSTFTNTNDAGIWVDGSQQWGIEWNALEDTPLWDIEEYLHRYTSIIIDDAHQYTPEFLTAVATNKPAGHLLVIGKNVGAGMEMLERTPGMSSMRISMKDAPLLTPASIEHEKRRYKDRPDVFELIYQVPYSWEPEKCRQ